MKATKVKFSQESLTKNEKEPMDPDLASRLYKDGGFFILKDLPERTEFGIDMNSWNTGLYFSEKAELRLYFFRSKVSGSENDPSRPSFYLLQPCKQKRWKSCTKKRVFP